MNLNLLFITARVVRSIYQIISTSMFLYYLATREREKDGRKLHHRR